ncbi:MAG: Ig-like domain-containing protein, partial [Bacteroidales bacterium]|nr:Ig-like domain-containing protein [Bacteroidales bacterium]
DGGKTATCAVTVKAKTVAVTGVSLAVVETTVFVSRPKILTATVYPSNATNKSVTWSSSNTAVATVDNNGKVTAKTKGEATITVRTVDGGFTATCLIHSTSSVSGHEYVDLGLPSGMLWATTNVGATKPEDNGYYYGWGMTTPYYDYDASWTRYFINLGGSSPSSSEDDCGTSRDPLKEYVTGGSKYYLATTAGTPDGIGGDTQWDAAAKIWQSGWRMPTMEEWKELITNCRMEDLTDSDGRKCTKYTSVLNNNYIILPWGGYKDGNGYKLSPSGEGVFYWSSSLDNRIYAYSTRHGYCWNALTYRYLGLLVRPVMKFED